MTDIEKLLHTMELQENKNNIESIEEIAAEASAHHMTYGKYVSEVLSKNTEKRL